MKIFLSYLMADWQWTDELASCLQANGIEACGSETAYRFGDADHEHLRQSLQATDLFVPVLTEQSLDAPQLMFEMGAALSMKKRVVPVRAVTHGVASNLPAHWTGRTTLETNSPQHAAEQIARYTTEQLAFVQGWRKHW